MKWKCKDKTVDCTVPVIMGILNVTPDSFHDGGEYICKKVAVAHAKEMLSYGADIIDIGAQSTRPGHIKISAEEELERLCPVIKDIINLGATVSVDTYYPEVAKQCLEWGVHIINDVSGTVNKAMLETVAKYKAGYIAMHTGFDGKDISEDMKDKSMVATDEITPIEVQVNRFFRNIVNACHKEDISDNRICLDVGIGFGKSFEQNKALLSYKAPQDLKSYPLLMGVSHKRVVRSLYGDDTLQGTIKCNDTALKSGFNIFRVHDVKEHIQWIKSL